MRWDDVLEAVTAEAVADPVLVALWGAKCVRMAGDNEYRAPGVDVRLVSDTITETWEPVTIQFDVWGASGAELAAGMRALHQLFDHEVPTTIQGVYMWSTYTEGSELGFASMGPDRGNVFGRAVRFSMIPVREDLRAGRSA